MTTPTLTVAEAMRRISERDVLLMIAAVINRQGNQSANKLADLFNAARAELERARKATIQHTETCAMIAGYGYCSCNLPSGLSGMKGMKE